MSNLLDRLKDIAGRRVQEREGSMAEYKRIVGRSGTPAIKDAEALLQLAAELGISEERVQADVAEVLRKNEQAAAERADHDRQLAEQRAAIAKRAEIANRLDAAAADRAQAVKLAELCCILLVDQPKERAQALTAFLRSRGWKVFDAGRWFRGSDTRCPSLTAEAMASEIDSILPPDLRREVLALLEFRANVAIGELNADGTRPTPAAAAKPEPPAQEPAPELQPQPAAPFNGPPIPLYPTCSVLPGSVT